ncbi:hypothetical protein TSAR_008528 [Trichomalopsis sarcophagae]|uniref:Uncharacterized protein n=1 Tax=Trichomalopsis sarcophagae TaxID=543379 RepID=A0A232F8Q2_9HYME|nr:hypothetical protein TSAR_008528 [Trichomalopsis sarcophagae]
MSSEIPVQTSSLVTLSINDTFHTVIAIEQQKDSQYCMLFCLLCYSAVYNIAESLYIIRVMYFYYACAWPELYAHAQKRELLLLGFERRNYA